MTHVDRGAGFTHYDGDNCTGVKQPRKARQPRTPRELKTYKEVAKKLARKKKISTRLARFIVLDEILDELPDGAYFAAMQEYGYEPEDIIELSEQRIGKKL